ncbi:glycosyltransferase [Phototrophicus methaneseepsis]|uniref:Glycosyltransferase n=1 Tax=Phototrophicus methaneseepsis TaxID=2710758 RepID=A0A7S8IEF2_9CHLR|nr:glycosyltransferase [Phototrophicus methaneseepsis]QPC82512.1 glycosyltransferase [Phototrophicus methaneseepsis]
MKIVHLTPYYVPAYAFGGVVSAVEGMAHAQCARGHEVTVLTTDSFDQQQRYDGPYDEIRDGVHVLRARQLSARLRGRFNLGTPLGLPGLARRALKGADVLHVHEFRTVENTRVLPVAVQKGVSVVMSPHGTLGYETGRGTAKSLWDDLVSRNMMHQIDRVIALTEQEAHETRALWLQYGLVPDVSIVPNGVDASLFAHLPDGAAFRERYRLGDGPVVLFMGRLHARKGIAELVEAFRLVAQPDARLVIAGPDEGMLTRITPHLDDRMIVTGYLDAEARLNALAAADLFVLPATGEGLSMAVLEAMAAALPVLLSPGCNLPEAQTTGAGLITEPTPQALAAALSGLLGDGERLRGMGQAARQLVQSRYTWEAVAIQLEQVYRAVIGLD